jgi:hypothetical protein
MAGTKLLMRSALPDRSTPVASDDKAGSIGPDREGDVTVVRSAGLCFVAGLAGQQPRPTHRSSADVLWMGRDLTFSAIAVPDPAIRPIAITQASIIFMAQSSWAATMGPTVA